MNPPWIAGRGRRPARPTPVFALLCLCAALLGGAATRAGAAPFVLPAAGCPMAHCDARMSDRVNAVSPAVGSEVHVDRLSAGAKGGLGCVSNMQWVACTGAGDPATQSNLIVYDADGNRLWQDPGVLGSTAWTSAALMSSDGNVIGVDQHWILRADPIAGTILWQSAKPDTGVPISPVLVGNSADMVLLATMGANDGSAAELSVWDVGTGSLLSHQAIVDPASAKVYVTRNTPAVRGNRAYVLTSADGDDADGRLYAVDICESAACGGRGTITPAWHFDFTGPSGASPLLIGARLFFDGQRGRSGGFFFAVDDLGAAPAPVWKSPFAGDFRASAAQDPRGGLWVYPWQTGTLVRLNDLTGATDQTIVVSAVLGLAAGYSPVTAVSVSASQAGAVVLTFGAQTKGQGGGIGPHVAAVDVSSTPAGTLLWKYKVSSNALRNAATGQFPIVTGRSGARRVVFRGTTSSTFFIGEP